MRFSSSKSRWHLLPMMMIGLSMATVPAQGNGNKGGKSGNAVDQDIAARILVTDAAPGKSGGVLRSDGQIEYVDGEAGAECVVGRRRELQLSLAKNASRRMYLQLGFELPPKPGDEPANPGRTDKVDFFATTGVPDPSFGPDGVHGNEDDGQIHDVHMRFSRGENVSALGAFVPDESVPNYCDPQTLQPIEPNELDAATFSHICTTVRMDFQSGQHRWRLFFGADNGYPADHPTPPGTGPIFLQRIFPDYPLPTPDADPSDPTIPWEIAVMPWDPQDPSTQDPLDPRYGAIVGFLRYLGTKPNSTPQYAGAFDIRWADATRSATPPGLEGAPWLAYPLQ